MAEKHLEIERKYDAAADFVLPDLSGLPGVAAISDPEAHSLHATYFDTADLRLAAHGITLRRRRGGADSGWHLKTPVGPDSRQELRAPLGRPGIVPAGLASVVAAYTRGAPLAPVATLETERTVVRLLDGAGGPLAEIADDAVTGRDLRGTAAGVAEAAAEPLAEVSTAPLPGPSPEPLGTRPADVWREIEVELAAGSPALLKAAGKRLVQAGAGRAGSSSKLARLLGGSIEPSTAATARALARARVQEAAPSAGDAVNAYLAAQVEAVLKHDPGARLAEDDAVHRMRVAVRRIRSVLQSYRPILDRAVTDPLRPELKWLAVALGEVRDLEVLRMRFTGRLEVLRQPDGPSRAGAAAPLAWLEDISRQERGAYRRLNSVLEEPRYFALLDALEGLVSGPPPAGRAGRKAAKELPGLVARSWRRLEKKYSGIEDARDVATARHDTRKAAKRARYAAELARPVLGSPAKRTVKNAKRIQEVLGDYQDGVIAMERLAGSIGRARGTAEAFALGALYGMERCEAEAARDRLASTWAKVSPPSP